MVAFQGIPAVIAAPLNQVHLFETVLAHVAGPEVAILPVESETPRIPQSIGPNLPSGVRGARKWVVRRNTIALVRSNSGNIDA